jgi:GntR family transcriptional repressor for pyruvate dehydrogenase complex
MPPEAAPQPPALSNLKSVHRSHAVRDQLLAAIKRGDFAPGSAIPSERQLGETFGVSRVSVREAIRSLEAMGLVEVHHGRGSFVTSGPGMAYLDPFTNWLQVHRTEVLELLKVRGALDELAAGEAATLHEEDDLVRLRAAQSAFAELAGRPGASAEDLTTLDIDFHLGVAKASHSGLLLNLSKDLHTQLSESRSAALTPPARPAESAAEHAAIVDAIARRNPDEARAATARHIASVERLLTDLADGRDPEGDE